MSMNTFQARSTYVEENTAYIYKRKQCDPFIKKMIKLTKITK